MSRFRRKVYDAYGYRLIWDPEHPRAAPNHYVKEHILVVERAFGRPVEAKHPIHHFDLDRANNANTNLVLCEDTAYHQILHIRQRIVARGGDPNLDKICSDCGCVLARTEFHADASRKQDGLNTACKRCHAIRIDRRRNKGAWVWKKPTLIG